MLDQSIGFHIPEGEGEPLVVDRQNGRHRVGRRGPDVPIDDHATMTFALVALPLDVSPFDPSAGVKPGQLKALFGGHSGALGTLGRSYRSPRRSLRVPPCQESHPERTNCNNCADGADNFPNAHVWHLSDIHTAAPASISEAGAAVCCQALSMTALRAVTRR